MFDVINVFYVNSTNVAVFYIVDINEVKVPLTQELDSSANDNL